MSVRRSNGQACTGATMHRTIKRRVSKDAPRRKWLPAVAVFLLLALIALLESSFNHAIGVRLLYVLPIWLVVRMCRTIEHLERKLQHANTLATCDPLTGVLNRTEVQARVEGAIERARNGGRQLAFAFVDCDRLKRVNDTYGHAMGDEVLIKLARRLHAATDNRGFVGRMGGDEFVVLFEGVSEARAKRRMDVVERGFVQDMRRLGIDNTMSFGLVSACGESTTFRSLMEAADSRMYARKHQAKSLLFS